MKNNVQPIPEGYNTVTPFIIVKNAESAIEFYKKAFNAEERYRLYGTDNKTIMHAEIIIGNSPIMLTEEFPDMKCLAPTTIGGNPTWFYVYVQDVDTFFDNAISVGAKIVEPVQDAFWGDRFGSLKDPFGHQWSIATHKKDLSLEEIKKGSKEFCAKMSKNRKE